jgi:hypothetical protein
VRHERVFVPPSVDAEVLEAARRHLNRARRRARRGRAVWFAAAAAAGVLLAAMMARTFFGFAEPRERLITRQQLDRGAKVDILDAFTLARHIEAGSAPVSCDLNNDGVVDRRDAAVLARRAVELVKGGGE